ncbi:2-oxo-tetronate isomerase [Labrys wisconsinensis]|uniref:Hydroxypyruvate isomerase n=1 Tax=Labrys wisconsinensis TaxID=425677 RepID=A0ABU0JCC1_9HYPH|nr:2-oxo-tetronate isomerase [Labrys wisconsinensis]MDQ0471941.1 hydroxypyruvate isomerase [Labrys wisconsinensis]
MPKFCANLKWLFTELPFLDRFDAAARAGFQAVEYASPYEFSAAEIRGRLRACGLRQVLFNTPAGGGSGMACVPARRDEFRDGVRKALDYAADLDCGLVHLMAGIVPSDLSRDTAAAAYAANVAWAADQAEPAGVRLVLEPINQRDVPGFFLRTQEEGAAVVEAIGRERIGLQFDIYHCQVAQGDVTRRLEALMPAIAHMQVADVPGRNEPGTGEIAWDYVFRRIDELGYAGWVGCEYRPATETSAGLGWLKRFSA